MPQFDQNNCFTALHSVSTAMLIAVLLATSSTTAHADKLGDNLQTVWESLWDQRGSARLISRWEQTVTFSVTGHDAASHRALIVEAVQAAADASGVAISELAMSADSSQTAVLQFEIYKDADLPDSQPCATYLKASPTFGLATVTVKLRPKDAWRCTYHEIMHAWGIPGHPSGKTVLSYFPYRSDQLMPMDRLMLKTWYLPAFKSGTTPIEALALLSAQVAAQTDLDLPVEVAVQRSQEFNLQKIEELKALASGKGEVPAIVRRSGRASESVMLESQAWAGFYLGLAYMRGTIVARNVQTSIEWMSGSAVRGHSPSQLLLARSLIRGLGIKKDVAAARGWLVLAAKSGNTATQTELQALDNNALKNLVGSDNEKSLSVISQP